MSRLMSQIKSKFLFVYVLLARKRTGNISYVKNSLLCTCRQTNQCWGTHNKISRDHPNKRTNAEELTTKFLETIQSVGLSVNDIKAQGYDGASVMSGHASGVQTRIRQVNPNAVYVHCRPHVLNLCIVHASKHPLVRNIMDTMQEVTWPLSSLQNVCWYLRNNLETILLLEKKWEDAQSWSSFVKRAGPPEQIACQFSLTLLRYYLIFIIWIIAHLLWAKYNGTLFLSINVHF